MTDINQHEDYQNHPQVALPNATAVLILGIISIIACCCYGGGIILGIIALILAAKDIKRYNLNPQMYTKGSYSNLNAGRICAIIGLVFSALFITMMLYIVATIGWATLQDPEALQQALENMK